MLDAQIFPCTESFDEFVTTTAVPSLPLILSYRGNSIEVLKLLDTGASVNALNRFIL